MGFWNFLSPKKTTVRTPLTPDELRAAGKTFLYRRTWRCSCGAELTIRARTDRSEGPSNFTPYAFGRHAGHAVQPAHELAWAGLAHERGWRADPVQCPACQRGLTMEQYKKLRRNGTL